MTDESRLHSNLKRRGFQHLLETSQRQRIIDLACSDPPEGRARGTVRPLV